MRGVNTRPEEGSPIDTFLVNSFSVFSPKTDYSAWLPAELHGWALVTVGACATVLFTSAPLAGLLGLKRADPGLAAAGVVTIAFLTTPYIVQLQSLLSVQMLFAQVSPRYVMSVAPVVGLVWGLILHRRRLDWLAALLAMTSFAMAAGTYGRVDLLIGV